MPSIFFNQVDFIYESPYVKIFDQLTLTVSTQWKTALVGNNGRGKSTLLGLLHRQLSPSSGHLEIPVETAYFPFTPSDLQQDTLNTIRDSIAPFNEWEQRMEVLLAQADESSLLEYGNILESYQAWDGYEIDAMIQKEMLSIGLSPQLLQRPFSSLSGGEQTRALIVALFLKKHHFFLIDEPTNHLDRDARASMGRYLSEKEGFIVVSHDRHFLDQCTDHVISINKNDVRLNQGNYSEWKYQMELEEDSERRRHDNLKREIRHLERASQQRRTWSGRKEKEKKGALDKGFVGARSASVMKRALAIEHRAQEAVEAKKSLLQNVEKERKLKIEVQEKAPEVILTVEKLSVHIEEKAIIQDLSFSLKRGERLAIVGKNGSGKTTLFQALQKQRMPQQGSIHMPQYIQVISSYQIPQWQHGDLRTYLQELELDESRFRQILGVLGVGGQIFDRPLETFSQGQLKKVDLCRSFMSPSHLLLWDEPMNYIDISAREQIEMVILEYQPTMLFIEHDHYFVEAVATGLVHLGE